MLYPIELWVQPKALENTKRLPARQVLFEPFLRMEDRRRRKPGGGMHHQSLSSIFILGGYSFGFNPRKY